MTQKTKLSPTVVAPIPLRLQWTKKQDGSVTFRALRANGTSTFSRGDAEGTAGFFVAHDLGHYAIETTLNLRGAFLGLVARGWDLGDFGTPSPRGQIPAENAPDAQLAEFLAGLRDQERMGTVVLTAEQVNEQLRVYFEQADLFACRLLTEGELECIREVHNHLLHRFHALPVGETLELTFPTEYTEIM